MYLAKFLFSPKGSKYQANFQFEQDLKCGVPASKILVNKNKIFQNNHKMKIIK